MVRTLLFALMMTVGAAAQNSNSFTVGTARAMRGQKATGVIAVPAGSDAATSIPVAVVNGALGCALDSKDIKYPKGGCVLLELLSTIQKEKQAKSSETVEKVDCGWILSHAAQPGPFKI